ncbi:isocitrate lyase/phosphoenolpyruvate mutase family protein [Bradyrhizobium sp. sBnM-33]|uniref:isocitrate lyase/phosphoenolpyruvate mutase family protein n=2 Tax=Bradyrhizobium sp. sBnM-33 TaxID=2831780 RepID=UPI001BCCD5F4
MCQRICGYQIGSNRDLSFLMRAHDGPSGAIAERTGFNGLSASGLSVASSVGYRDASEASWSQRVVAGARALLSDDCYLLEGDVFFDQNAARPKSSCLWWKRRVVRSVLVAAPSARRHYLAERRRRIEPAAVDTEAAQQNCVGTVDWLGRGMACSTRASPKANRVAAGDEVGKAQRVSLR